MNWNTYLLQVNLFLVVFYGFYWLLLRKETYNVNNRIFLVFSAVLSLLLPLWNSELMQSWSVTKQVSEVFFDTSIHDPGFANPESDMLMGLSALLLFFYVCGFTFSFLKFLTDLIRVRIHARQPSVSAFSFFYEISVDEGLDQNEIITEHELVHARQGHSFDVILFEILGIICWFNPVIYFYKTAIRNIHEFIADEIASEQMASKADYALLLLSQQFRVANIPLISTFFSYKNLKLRIQMLKKERSGRGSLIRYALTVPLFITAMVMVSAVILSKKNTQKLYEIAIINTVSPPGIAESALITETDQPGEEKSVYIELQTVTSWRAYSIFSRNLE